jgi:hypothetical protein
MMEFVDEELERMNEHIRRERNMLAEAIGNAALKAGIYNGEVSLTGPHLLMLANDMAEVILECEKNINLKADFIEATMNDMAGRDQLLDEILDIVEGRTFHFSSDTVFEMIAHKIRMERNV